MFKRILIFFLTLLVSVSFALPCLAEEKAGTVSVDLTAEERAFLDGKQVRLGVDSARPPFEFIDEKGVYSGISAGFVQACLQRLGVPYVLVPGLTVAAAMKKMAAGEVDVIPKIAPDPERAKSLIFTRSHATFASVIVTRQNVRSVKGIDDLAGLKVGVLKGLIVEATMKRDFPDMPLISQPDVRTALVELSSGKIDVYIEHMAIVSYNIEKLNLTNLKIAAQTPYNYEMAFGVRKDWPLLASALDKALASLSKQEKAAITGRWLTIEYQQPGMNWKVYLSIGAVLFIIIVAAFLWNRHLRRIIRERERIQDELKEQARLLEFRSTIKAQLSQISVGLQKTTTLEELARTFLSQVATLTDAAYGVFFLMDEQKQLLQAVGGYGWLEAEVKIRQFRIGQGLPGQCAREKKPLSFINAPGNSSRITWGGGQFNPRAILLLPVLEQDHVLAVIELGALQPFTPEHRALLDELLPMVALNLLINQRNVTTRELLAKGQEQIAELGKVRKATLNILEDLEASRRETEATMQKMTAMSQAVNDAMVMIDGQGKVLFWNQAAEKLFGYTIAEAMGMDFHTLAVSPELREKAQAGMETFAATGQGVLFGSARETTAINRRGEPFPVEVNLSPFPLNGQWFAVGTVRDITERKRADALKVGKEVAEEAAARAERARQEAERSQAELQAKVLEIERFNRLSVGREQRIIDLKRQINDLAAELGRDVSFRSPEQDEEPARGAMPVAEVQTALDAAEIKQEFIELLQRNNLQELFTNFCTVAGVSAAIIDLEANILAASPWQRACTDFHRVNKKSCERCIESDTNLALNLQAGRDYALYRCGNGLTDCASPIIIEGRHIANVFIGQFLLTAPDDEFFAKQAVECGFDRAAYLQAVHEAPVMDEARLPNILGFLSLFSKLIGSFAVEQWRARRAELHIHNQAVTAQRERTAAMSLAEDANQARLEIEHFKESLELLVQERTAALRQAGDEQVAIFESLTLGIAFVKDRIILRGNSKLGELFGRPLEEMVGQTTRIWYKSDDDYLGTGASTYEALDQQVIHQREQELLRKDGSLFWCLFRVRALDVHDVAQGIVCTLEDITERKQAEIELKEKMEELERFSRLTINREEKMIQLKEEINSLLEQTGQEKKYTIVE